MSEVIHLSHGAGGSTMHEFLARVIFPAFDNPILRQGNDQAVMEVAGARIAFSTDSYVVDPLFFPGGCIGDLAVHGTINDVAMCGAVPVALSAAMIVEEGLPMDTVRLVVDAMRRAAAAAGVPIVTGDTKVVGRGGCDGMFVTTAGIGVVPAGVVMGGDLVRPGDAVIVSGSVGEHGIAIASRRKGLAFDTAVRSDTAPLHGLVAAMLATSGRIHAMRDPTRGGMATTINEIARQSGVCIEIDEDAIPVSPGVRQACAVLGFDPLHLACEGRLVAFADSADAATIVDAMQAHPAGAAAAVIGRVVDGPAGVVRMRTSIGGLRLVAMPAGELLPRIC